MPTYQYACTDCGHDFEAFQSFSDEALSECPACHGRLRKVFNSVGIVFKGSGFYRTDSREKSGAGATKETSTKDSGGTGKDTSGSKDSGGKDSGSSTSTGTKPAAASASKPATGTSSSTTGSAA